MNSFEPSSKSDLMGVYALAAGQMVRGASESEIRRMLFEGGIGADVADELVTNLVQLRAEVQNEAARRVMRRGLCCCLGGITTALTAYIALNGGAFYLAGWAAALFGTFEFFRGVLLLR